MGIFIQGNPALDFFDQNPELRYYHHISDLIKIHGLELASKYMWALYLFEDPNSSFYKIPHDERKLEISEYYLKDINFDWDILSELSKHYSTMALDKNQVLYKLWADKIDEALVHVKGLAFSSDHKQIMEIMDKISKMWTTYEKVEKKMIEGKQKANVRGGASLSIREKRMRKKMG